MKTLIILLALTTSASAQSISGTANRTAMKACADVNGFEHFDCMKREGRNAQQAEDIEDIASELHKLRKELQERDR